MTAVSTAPKPRVRINTTPEERAEWVRHFEESGKSAPEFCKELGLAESTFAVWRKQVREASNPTNLTFTDMPLSVACEPTSLAITLPNGMRLEVPAGFDTVWLGQLLSVLRT